MITIIGDVHGKYDDYLNIVRNCNYTVQVGDFGFNYDCLENVDSNCHKIIGGNHDNYDIIDKVPHSLGNFGVFTLNGISFFFIRGEHSVDKVHRIEGVSWWKEEELNYKQASMAIDLYEKTKPEIVLSHGCPSSILPDVITNSKKIVPSSTAKLLQAMYDIWNPSLWYFGHHHNNKTVNRSKTKFLCLDELSIAYIMS